MRLAPLLLALAFAASAGAQTEATFPPSQDATLYESDTGDLANSAGASLFVGRVQFGGRVPGAGLRRAVLAFDIAGQVPAGATIETVELDLTVTRANNSSQTPVGVYRLTHGWSEGTTDPPGQEGRGAVAGDGDATWVHTSRPGAVWEDLGGDRAPVASATASVGGRGLAHWTSTDALVADVQGWLDDPASNAGWLLVGDETAPATAKRFASREGPEPERPALRVTYSGDGTAAADGPEGGVTLLGAVPNPFADATAIAFSLETPEAVTVEVFDALGRRVAVVADGPFAAGPHRVGFIPGDLPEGVYVVRLRAGEAVRVARMVRAR